MERALDQPVLEPGGLLVHRNSPFFPFYRGLARFLPLPRRLRFQFEGSREGEREGLVVPHVTPTEVERLERAGHQLAITAVKSG